MPTRSSAGRSASARFVKVRLPVTVTSALMARCSTTLIGAGLEPADTVMGRFAGAKLTSEYINSKRPSGTSRRYAPAESVRVEVTPAPSLCAATVTPERAPPVSSRTVPFTACPDAAAATSTCPSTSPRIRARFIGSHALRMKVGIGRACRGGAASAEPGRRVVDLTRPPRPPLCGREAYRLLFLAALLLGGLLLASLLLSTLLRHSAS